jgi:hypothetical protein
VCVFFWGELKLKPLQHHGFSGICSPKPTHWSMIDWSGQIAVTSWRGHTFPSEDPHVTIRQPGYETHSQSCIEPLSPGTCDSRWDKEMKFIWELVGGFNPSEKY